jgi:hypothetical protein
MMRVMASVMTLHHDALHDACHDTHQDFLIILQLKRVMFVCTD